MVFYFKTKVSQPASVVIENFDSNLLTYLSNKFIKIEVISFDGHREQDIIKLSINALGYKFDWTSEIIFSRSSANYLVFTDNGMEMPSPFTLWKHTHTVIPNDTVSTIIKDSVEYKTKSKFLDYMLFPFVAGMFLMRAKKYKEYFKI